jgi:hypothetical protein
LSESSWRPAFCVAADAGTAFGDGAFVGRATAMPLAATKKAKKRHRHAETLIVSILPFGSAFSKLRANLQASKPQRPKKLHSSSTKYHRWLALERRGVS